MGFTGQLSTLTCSSFCPFETDGRQANALGSTLLQYVTLVIGNRLAVACEQRKSTSNRRPLPPKSAAVYRETDEMPDMEPALALYELSSYEMIWEKKVDTKCLIAWGSGTVVVAFRGTASAVNLFADLEVRRGLPFDRCGRSQLSDALITTRRRLEGACFPCTTPIQVLPHPR